jgi:hypothetical protein
MPPEKKPDVAVDTPPVTQPDAFGQTPDVAPEPVVDAPKVEAPDKAIEFAEKIGVLTTELLASKDLHTKKDADIRAMADKIKALEKNNGGAPEGGKEQEGEVPFKEIKTSKDLTEDERDDMTDAEIKALDEMAILKQTINNMAIASSKATANAGAGVETVAVDVNATVQAKATELAGGDIAVANQIIEAYKLANFNTEGLTVEQIQLQVQMATAGVPTYKPKTESSMTPDGKPAGGGTTTDPHGVDAIVAEVAKTKGQESYSL